MFPLPVGRWPSPPVDRSNSLIRASFLITSRHRRRRSGLRDFRWFPLSKHLLHAPDDPVARHQHAADDDDAEDDELKGRGKAHHAHHLVEARQEERRGPRRQRAGQPPGERRAADDDGGDRPKEVGSPDRDADGAQDSRQQDPRHPVEDRREHVGRHLVQVDPQAGDARRGGVGADHLEPAARRGEPEDDDQDDRKATPTQNVRVTPRNRADVHAESFAGTGVWIASLV